MKRRLAFVLSCLLAVGTVAGCGGSNDNGGSAADTNGGASASAQ